MSEPPDFEVMIQLASTIRDLSFKKIKVKAQIEAMESEVIKHVIDNKEYWPNDKQPSMEYIKLVYKPVGLNGEILEKWGEYAQISSDLEYAQLNFEINKAKLDVWKTETYMQSRVSL